MRYQRECACPVAKGDPLEPAYRTGDMVDRTYNGNRPRPTQKPVPVLLPLVQTFSASGGLVLEPLAGSGSSLLAGKILARAYVRIEPDAGDSAAAAVRLAGEADPAA